MHVVVGDYTWGARDSGAAAAAFGELAALVQQ
jgi:hypothetical protein